MRKSTPTTTAQRELHRSSAASAANKTTHNAGKAAQSGGDADSPHAELVDSEDEEAAGDEPDLAAALDGELIDADPGVVDLQDLAGEDALSASPGPAAGRGKKGRSVVVEVSDGKSTTSLARSDPLTVYMHEIRRYPLLTREEEHELAVRFAETQDPKIARRLITANLRLVVKIAHEYRRAYRNLLDLVQEGNLGLLQAVQKYDPHRGVKLSSYAAWWIRAYMLKFILNNWRLVKIGTTQAQRKLFFNLTKEREKLEAAGFVPTTKLLAERLSVPEQEVAEMQMRLSASEASLDAPIGGDDESGKRTHLDLLESANATRPDVSTESEEFRALLRSKLEAFESTLKGREQTLFHDRLMADQPLTLQEVGERYGISRERARQIEARLLSRLKMYLKKELGDAVQVAMGLD